MPNKLPENAEIFPLVNEKDELIGSVLRSVANFNPQYIHRVVGLIIKDKKDNYLLQKRSASKDKYPNLLTIAMSGHVEYGDNYIETVIRETKEEIGYKIKTENLIEVIYGKYATDSETEFWKIYELVLTGIDLNLFKFDKEEVSDLVIMSKKEIIAALAKKSTGFTPKVELVFKDYFKL